MGCFDVVMNTEDMVKEAVASFNLPEDCDSNIRLADFGCADGGPEMPLVHRLKSMLPADCQLEVRTLPPSSLDAPVSDPRF